MMLAAYHDCVKVRAAQAALRRAQSDWESFQIVREFGSNAFRNLLAKAGIDTYGKFLDFNAERLWAIPGIGKTKVEEFKIVRELFDCGSRRDVPPPLPQKNDEVKEEIPPDFNDVPHANEPIPGWRLKELGTKCHNIIESLCPGCRAGDVAGLTRKALLAKKNCAKKRADAIMTLVKACRDGSVWTPTGVFAKHANEFDSLSDMILKSIQGDISLNDAYFAVMRMYLGLLDVTKCETLRETGKCIHVTHECVRQMGKKVLKALKEARSATGFSDLAAWAAGFFEAHGMEASEAEIVESAANAFGWIKPTAFSLGLVLEKLGFEMVVNPQTGLVAWNRDGCYDWVAAYKPPTSTEMRRAAIKAVLQEAGRDGLTIDEIISACTKKHANADVGEGNVRGCLSNGGDLDSDGTRIIGFLRGKRGEGGTRYSLNTFFQDDETKSVLKKAGEELKAYVEKTGFGVVDVWKIWHRHKDDLPADKYLPKLGFYMMMRDVGAGGLCYKDYPRVSYEGMEVCENAYWWELYEYFHYCGHSTATFAQIMSFFVDCLGVQPNVAVGSTFPIMGLSKVEGAMNAPYEIKRPPIPKATPTVLLKTTQRDETLSLIKADGKYAIHSDYFDEDGHAIYHPTYVRIFMRALEKSGIEFSHEELTQLTDAGWCKQLLKIPHPLLKKANGDQPKGKGYWLEKFNFNGEMFYVCCDWHQANKSAFDTWAESKAKQAGFKFEPYEIDGAEEDE
ncbi:MAG: hypothetical protein IJH50_13905 [Kiritimatiellae bacterium]|nr:hypothetical protein [Kiritimatiellia bacterium]